MLALHIRGQLSPDKLCNIPNQHCIYQEDGNGSSTLSDADVMMVTVGLSLITVQQVACAAYQRPPDKLCNPSNHHHHDMFRSVPPELGVNTNSGPPVISR